MSLFYFFCSSKGNKNNCEAVGNSLGIRWEIDLKLKDEPFSDNQEHDFFSGVKRSLADDSITVSNYLSDAAFESSKKKRA